MMDKIKLIRPAFPNSIMQYKYLHFTGDRCSSCDLCTTPADHTTEVANVVIGSDREVCRSQASAVEKGAFK